MFMLNEIISKECGKYAKLIQEKFIKNSGRFLCGF